MTGRLGLSIVLLGCLSLALEEKLMFVVFKNVLLVSLWRDRRTDGGGRGGKTWEVTGLRGKDVDTRYMYQAYPAVLHMYNSGSGVRLVLCSGLRRMVTQRRRRGT